jgi:hypothetical protein
MVMSAETLALLREQFSGTTGFLARLQRGDGIDHDGVRQVWQALDTLRTAWAEQECIPVEALLVLMQVDDAIFPCIDRYLDAGLQRAVEDLGVEMQQRVEATLLPQPDHWTPEHDNVWSAFGTPGTWERWCQETVLSEAPLSEIEALTIAHEHLAGPGFLFALRTHLAARNPACVAKALRLIHQALDTLAPAWARDACIPKDLALWFVQVRDLVVSGWTLYERWPDATEAQQLLLRIRDELSNHLTQSLQGKAQDKG